MLELPNSVSKFNIKLLHNKFTNTSDNITRCVISNAIMSIYRCLCRHNEVTDRRFSGFIRSLYLVIVTVFLVEEFRNILFSIETLMYIR